MNKFLMKLISEEKIKLVESSEDIAIAYLHKSGKSLLSAKTLVNIENLDDAIALTYYSMYYSVLALLFKIGIKSENHTGSILLLKEIFDLDVSELQKAKKDRVDKQYYVDFSTTKKEVLNAIILAEEFNAKIKLKIDTISLSEVEQYNEKAKSLLFTDLNKLSKSHP